MATSFTVNATQLMSLADNMTRAPQIVQEELKVAGFSMGEEMVAQARALTVGSIAAGIGPAEVSVSGPLINIRVEAHDPKSLWHEEGTGIYGRRGTPIRPVSAKFLSWIGPDGQRIFAREVRGVPAKWFMRDGLQRARARIQVELRAAALRVANRLISGER